jgi:hypothetical protein
MRRSPRAARQRSPLRRVLCDVAHATRGLAYIACGGGLAGNCGCVCAQDDEDEEEVGVSSRRFVPVSQAADAGVSGNGGDGGNVVDDAVRTSHAGDGSVCVFVCSTTEEVGCAVLGPAVL